MSLTLAPPEVAVPAGPSPRDGASGRRNGRLARFARSPKGWLTLAFLAELAAAAAGSPSAPGWSAALPHVLAAVAGAIAVDLVGAGVGGRGWRWPSSALLSGLIVAFVLAVETPWLATATVGALASLSKLLLRTRRGHIFNPAALALLVAIPLLATGQSWWGAMADQPWPWLIVMLVGGLTIVDRVNKMPMVLSFLGLHYALFTAVALASPGRVAELFRAPFVEAALFLAFFMLTDPPTSPGRDRDQLWIGALVGLTSALAQLLGAGQGYLLIGLLIGNVALWLQRRAHERAAGRDRRSWSGAAAGSAEREWDG